MAGPVVETDYAGRGFDAQPLVLLEEPCTCGCLANSRYRPSLSFSLCWCLVLLQQRGRRPRLPRRLRGHLLSRSPRAALPIS